MLEIRVLGPLHAARDGRPIGIAGGRRSAVLARIALAAGDPVGAARLIDEVWGPTPGTAAANSLQVAVWTLRKALGPDAIVTTPGGYALGRSVSTDVGSFTEAIRTAELRVADGDDLGASANYAMGLALWRGTALEGIAAPFADEQRDLLAERRIAAITALSFSRIRLGIHAPVVAELGPLIAQHPYREDLHAAYALGLAGVGRRVEALAAISVLRRRLRQEIGVDAGAQLDEAHRSILRGPDREEGTAVAVIRSGLRRVPPPMLGREDARRHVGELLARPDVRLVTVLGPGGVGKTRLAESVVESSSSTVAFASLVSAQQDGDSARVVAQELGVLVGPEGAEEAVAVALSAANEIDVLVLDNLEHLADAAGLVDRLLARIPGLTILATSRAPLYLPVEHRLRLRPLAVDDGLADDAERLFVDAATRHDPAFHVSPPEETDLARIVRACEGLPLALELAASWTDVLAVRELADRLSDRLELLVDAGRGSDSRFSSVRASIDWSLEQLDTSAARTLHAASVFVGGSTIGGLAAVTGIPETEVRRHVASLVDRSVLSPVPGASGRFDMLQVIREAAVAGMRAEHHAELRHAHVVHMHRLIARPARTRVFPSTAAEAELLRVESTNIRAALRAAIDIDRTRFCDLLETISTGWSMAGGEQEVVEWADVALARDDLTPSARFDCLLAAERAINMRGGAAGRRLLDELQDLEPLVDRDRRLALLVRVAYSPLYEADVTGAEAGAARLRLALGPGDEPELELLADQLDAVVLLQRGDHERGVRLLRHAASRAGAAGLELHARTIVSNLSEALLWYDDGREAEQVCLAQLATLPSDATMLRAVATRNLGLALLLQGSTDRAVAALRLALRLMHGGSHVADRLTIALGLAGLRSAPRELRSLVLAGWDAAEAAGDVSVSPLEARLLARLEPRPSASGQRGADASTLDRTDIPAMVDAIVDRILHAPEPAREARPLDA